MQPQRLHPALIAAVLALALVLRLAAGVWWQTRLAEGQRFAYADSYSYWVLAEHLARGEPYEFGSSDARVFRMPGYPLLLASLFVVAGEEPPVLWSRVLNALLGTLAVAGVLWLARQLFDPTTALVAALLAAVSPSTVAMSALVLSEAPFCPLMLGQLSCWIAAWRAPQRFQLLMFALLGGLLGGCATLVRPSWLLFTPFALLLALIGSQDRKRQLLVGACLLVGLIVTMTPWWLRNYHVTGRFVPTTLQTGASLYDGLNPDATGASDMSFVRGFEHRQRAADAAGPGEPPSVFEYRLDQRMRDAALGWALRNPQRVLQLAGSKLLRMWNVWPNAAELQSWPIRLVMMAGYVPLLVLAAVGAVRWCRQGWPFVLCCLPAVYFSALHMIFASSIRYREPALLPLMVLAAATICWLAPVGWVSDPTTDRQKTP